MPGQGTWMAAVISLLFLRAAAAKRKGSQGKSRGRRSKKTKGSDGTGSLWAGGSGLPAGCPQFTPFSRVGRAPGRGCGTRGHTRCPCAMPLRRKDTQRGLEAQMRLVGCGRNLWPPAAYQSPGGSLWTLWASCLILKGRRRAALPRDKAAGSLA